MRRQQSLHQDSLNSPVGIGEELVSSLLLSICSFLILFLNSKNIY